MDPATVKLVDRDLLRCTRHGRTFSAPTHLLELMKALPAPPQTFDHSLGRKIKYPTLGNDQEGDCYYTAVCHQVQTWTGGRGAEAQFTTQQVLHRYDQLSPRDQGLNDQVIIPEFKHGIVGPGGPHKIVEDMTVDPEDAESVKFALWRFYGLTWTCALLGGRLPGGWLRRAGPNVVWDIGMQPDQNSGHAMHLTGIDADGNYQVETWGIDPAVKVTRRGLLAADSELIVFFSLEMFDPQTGLTPDGKSYDEMAQYWAACGGPRLPPSPFPPPPTPPPPSPIDWGPDVIWD